MIPDYLTDQNIDYIKARGYSFKDFSAEQVIDALKMRDILNNTQRGFTTIIDNLPDNSNTWYPQGAHHRWHTLRNPFTRFIYRCIRLKHTRGFYRVNWTGKRLETLKTIDKRPNKILRKKTIKKSTKTKPYFYNTFQRRNISAYIKLFIRAKNEV